MPTPRAHVAEIGPCGYAEPQDAGDVVCQRSGRRVVVRDPLGALRSIVRCREHSDWIEAEAEWDTPATAPHSD